jgi:hypothetical protein
MNGRKRQLQIAATSGLTLALLIVAVRWSLPSKRFASPEDCLGAYYEACLAGDADLYSRCWATPLRSEIRHGLGAQDRSAELLQQKAVKNWVVVAQPAAALRTSDAEVSMKAQGPTSVLVDEVRPAGIKRIRFRLELLSGSWLIIGIERVEERQPSVPFGTEVRDAVEDEATE